MCEHENWGADVEVNRLTGEDDGPVTGYVTEIRAHCTDCGAPMIWHVPDFGVLSDRPTVNVSGQELRVPGRPADKSEYFGLQLPGFSIRGFMAGRDN